MSESAGLTVRVDPVDPGPPPAGPSKGRRRRWPVVVLTVVAVVTAGVGGGVAAFWASVQLPPLRPLAESTTIYYADGATVLARFGDVDRTTLRYEELLPTVVDVTIAAEDPEFWSNTAGPITRAVVRHGFDLEDPGNNARLRVWVLARKLEAAHSKEAILAYYLNAVPFGRDAYGIEAAARAYFGKSASRSAPVEQRLTVAEAMMLLARVRQPYADPADPGLDPGSREAAEANPRQRWAEIRDSLADLVRRGPTHSGLVASEVSGISYPTPAPPATEPVGIQAPVGLVVNHVLAELTHTPGSQLAGRSWADLRNGGFEITTTIDMRAQKILEIAAGAESDGSPMFGQPSEIQAAGVLIEPGTGRVLAYYGGQDPTGIDYAGVYRDEDGQPIGFGAHPPGGSFMVYTLAAALRAGYSLDSRWQWTQHEQAGRDPRYPIRNSSLCGTTPDGETCSLLDSLVYSLNVPMYDVTASVGASSVIAMARDVGISAMWNDARDRLDLTAPGLDAQASGFGNEVGIGQYPVTVLDQAAAMSTLARGGVPAPAHFVRTVTKGDQLFYGEPLAGGEPVLSAGELADLTYALSAASATTGPPTQGSVRPYDLAIKTGAWEHAPLPGMNSNAWSIGFTTAVAVAIWVGNRGEERALIDKDGAMIYGSGLPTQILRQVIDETQQSLDLGPFPFPPPVLGGDINPPGSVPS